MTSLRACGCSIAAAIAFTLHTCARTQDRCFASIDDPLVRNEIAQFPSYQELRMELVHEDLQRVAVRSSSSGHIEFADEAVRVRIDAYPFHHMADVRRSAGAWAIDGLPALGFTPGEDHTRIARVEAVLDGMVVHLPTSSFLDVFDVPLWREGEPYAAVLRSPDGYRTYVHLQAGEGSHARLITWVIDDGEFLFRVVERLE